MKFLLDLKYLVSETKNLLIDFPRLNEDRWLRVWGTITKLGI